MASKLGNDPSITPVTDIPDSDYSFVIDGTTGHLKRISGADLKIFLQQFTSARYADTTTNPADNPGVSWYYATAGIYTYFLDDTSTPIEVTEGDGLVILNYNGTYWEKKSVGLDLSGYTPITSFDPVKSDVDNLNTFLIDRDSADGFFITDENGNVVVKVDYTGLMSVVGLIVNSFTATTINSTDLISGLLNLSDKVVLKAIDDYNLVITDEAGWIVFNSEDSASSGSVLQKNPRLITGEPTDIVMFDSYGQSLSVGGSGGAGPTGVSTVQKYDSLMFNLGARSTAFGGVVPSSFVPLVESASNESLCSGCLEALNQLIEQTLYTPFTNKGFQFFGCASGESDRAIAELNKGTTYYNRMLNDFQYAKDIATGLGKSFSIGFIGWTQGEADYDDNTDPAVWRAAVVQLLKDINADALPITGQKNSIPFVIGQTSSNNWDSDSQTDPGIALMQLDLCLKEPNMIWATPMYMLDYFNDGVSNRHLTGNSYRILAAYYALAYKKTCIDGKKAMPLCPVKSFISGNNINMYFHVPVAPLVFDTTQVVDPGNYGFRVFDASDTELTINSIAITEPDRVTITCSASPVGGEVWYAINGNLNRAGRLTGNRGCLRDSQGDALVFDPEGNSWPMHNWCAIFKQSL